MIDTRLMPNDTRTIRASTPPEGMTFDVWTGDVEFLSDPTLAETIVAMGNVNVAIRALFKVLPGGYGLLYNFPTTQPQTTINYGYLYNWDAATDSRGVATSNAHVPSRDEWESLFNSIDIFNVNKWPLAGGKLKAIGNTYWNNNIGAINEFGFGAIGGGERDTYTGNFTLINEVGMYLSTTTYFMAIIQVIFLDHTSEIIKGTNNDKTLGQSIRLIIDTPIEINGTHAIYVGNDGKRYNCVLINGVWWLAENLMETKYANGDLIPEVTGNTAWAALTTGGRCSYNNLESNAGSVKRLAPDGYSVASKVQWDTLITYCGGDGVAGGKLKEFGGNHWGTPNIEATNEVGFNSRGSGIRNDVNGVFGGFKNSASQLSLTEYSADTTRIISFTISIMWGGINSNVHKKTGGGSIRLIKDDPTSWTIGDTVTDMDENVYQTVKIGDQVWIAENWKSTKWSDGSPINYVEGNSEWAALTTPAYCYPNGMSENV